MAIQTAVFNGNNSRVEGAWIRSEVLTGSDSPPVASVMNIHNCHIGGLFVSGGTLSSGGKGIKVSAYSTAPIGSQWGYSIAFIQDNAAHAKAELPSQ